MTTGTSNSTRSVIDSPTDQVPTPYRRPEPGRHRHERSGAVHVTNVLADNGRPLLTSSQQLMARIRGDVA